MITFDTILDTAALLRAPHAEKVAVTLAWNEHCNLNNGQTQRDEWARAFCRQVLMYLSTTRPN